MPKRSESFSAKAHRHGKKQIIIADLRRFNFLEYLSKIMGLKIARMFSQRIILLLILFQFIEVSTLFGQNFKGFNASKQGGFYGMINQPTRILDGDKRLNINVIGVDLNILGGSEPTSASSIFNSGGSPDLLKLAFVGKADVAIFARVVFPALTYK